MQLIITRHGHTSWNDGFLYQGSTDNELSKLGKEQAKKLAKRLAGEKFEVIYSSPLKRALATAKEIQKLSPHAKIITDDKLKEFDFGAAEGLSYEKAMAHKELGRVWIERQKDKYNFVVPNGESFYLVRERVKKVLKRILADGKDALIVSHGVTSKMIFMELLGKKFEEVDTMRYKNTAITRILIKGNKIELMEFNDAKHLEEK
jgi:broad specificity phosphatase PhoE